MPGFRSLPAVNELAKELQAPHALAVQAARATIEERRTELRDGATDDPDLLARARERVARAKKPSLRRVLNATGVIVHTNLGRAPLAAAAREAVTRAAEGYSTLEWDAATGTRGSRHDHVEALLTELTGAEAALAVNNGAAAVLLAAAALAGPGHEIVVSRGQLVEIGGGFRIPDVVAQAGATLKEVGTTNRTRRADYAGALTDRTGAILRAHPSNFRQLGFVQEVEIEELCELGVPVIDDVGSGNLAEDLALLADEPPVRRSVKAGAALVCFSGDKLLGGPQAGVMVGTHAAVQAAKQHPLARATRLDKLSLAALEATLRLYRDPTTREIPVLQMLTADDADAPRQGAAARRRPRRGRRVDRQGRRRRAAAARAARPGGRDPRQRRGARRPPPRQRSADRRADPGRPPPPRPADAGRRRDRAGARSAQLTRAARSALIVGCRSTTRSGGRSVRTPSQGLGGTPAQPESAWEQRTEREEATWEAAEACRGRAFGRRRHGQGRAGRADRRRATGGRRRLALDRARHGRRQEASSSPPSSAACSTKPPSGERRARAAPAPAAAA